MTIIINIKEAARYQACGKKTSNNLFFGHAHLPEKRVRILPTGYK
jgi:hypothetical protein